MSLEVGTLLQEAETAKNSGEFEKALELYQSILEASPHEARVYYEAANVYAIRGLVSEVVGQYLKLVEVLEEKTRFDGALEVCQWVVSIDPSNTQARSKLIALLEKQGKSEEAFHQSLSLSRIHVALGQGEHAIHLLQELRGKEPENSDVSVQLGEIYIQQGQIGDGLSLYKETAKKLIAGSDYGKALEIYKRIKAIKLNDLENLFSLGQTYVQLGRVEEGKSEFRQILRQNLNHGAALFQLGLIAVTQHQWEEARVPFRKILDLEPENAEAHEYFGEINQVLENPEEAIEQYLAAAKLYEKSARAEKAVELYQNILAVRSDSQEARERLQALAAPVQPKRRDLGVSPLLEVALPQEKAKEEEAVAELPELLPKRMERKLLFGVAEDGSESPLLAEWEESRQKAKRILQPRSQFTSKKEQKKSGIFLRKGGTGKQSKSVISEGLINKSPLMSKETPVSGSGKKIFMSSGAAPVQETKEVVSKFLTPAEPLVQESQPSVGQPEEITVSKLPSELEEGLLVSEAPMPGEPESFALEEPVASVAEPPVEPEEGLLVSEAPMLGEPESLALEEPVASVAEPPVEPEEGLLVSEAPMPGEPESLFVPEEMAAAIAEPPVEPEEGLLISESLEPIREIFAEEAATKEEFSFEEEISGISYSPAGVFGEAVAPEEEAVPELLYSEDDVAGEEVAAREKGVISEEEPGVLLEALSEEAKTVEENGIVEAIPVVSEAVQEEAVSALPPLRPEVPLVDLEQLLSQGRLGPAITWCKQALKETPGNLTLKTLSGKVYYQAGFLEEALELFREVAEETKELEILQKVAEIYLLQDRKTEWADALSSYLAQAVAEDKLEEGIQAALEILGGDPSAVEARRSLVLLLKRKGLESFALYHQRELIEMLERSNNLSQLIPAYRQLLDWKPQEVSLRYKLALCYQETGTMQQAKEEFLRIADQQEAGKEYQKAVEILERVLAFEPEDRSVISRLRDFYSLLVRKNDALSMEMRLGDLAFAGEDLETALQSYRKVLGEDPSHVPAMEKTVLVYTRKGNLEEAISLAGKLAESCAKNGQPEKGIAVYESLLTSDPENPVLHRGLAALYGKTGQRKAAVEEYMKIGSLALRKDLFDEAVEAYQEVLLLDGSCKEARFQLGTIYADRKNDWESALSEFKKVRSLDPEHAPSLARLVQGYVILDQVEVALEYFRDLITLDSSYSGFLDDLTKETVSRLKREPGNDSLRYNLGLLYNEQSKCDEAIREFQSIIHDNSVLTLKAYAHQGLAWEKKAAEQQEEAYLQTALKVYKRGMDVKGRKEEEYLEISYRAASLLEVLGKLSEARALFEEIVAVDADYKDARKRKKKLEDEIGSGKVTRLQSRRQEAI